MWDVKEVTERWPRAQQEALFPLGPLPHIQRHNASMCVALPWQIPKAICVIRIYVTGVPRQKKMAQMEEQIKAPEEIQLSDEEIANLSEAEFKTLVIRMLTEIVDYGRKIQDEVRLCKVK